MVHQRLTHYFKLHALELLGSLDLYIRRFDGLKLYDKFQKEWNIYVILVNLSPLTNQLFIFYLKRRK